MRASTPASKDPRRERAHVHPAADGGIGGVEDLEAAVDDEPVDGLAGHPPADVRRCLEHHDLAAGVLEDACAPQTREARSHHDHVGVHARTLAYENAPRAAGSRNNMPSDQVRWVMIGPRMPPVTRRCRPTTRPTTAAARTSSGMPLVATTSA